MGLINQVQTKVTELATGLISVQTEKQNKTLVEIFTKQQCSKHLLKKVTKVVAD